MTKNQKGFGLVEVILTVLLVILLGALGWVFYDNSQKDDTANTNSTQATIKPEKTKSETSDWYEFTPKGGEYTMKVADGWELYKKQGSEDSLYSMGDMALKEGTQGKVLDSESSVQPEFLCGLYLDWSTFADAEEFEYNGQGVIDETKVAFQTDTGADVRSEKVSRENSTHYIYHILNGEKSMVTVGYNTCQSKSDNHDVVEKVVKTIRIND